MVRPAIIATVLSALIPSLSALPVESNGDVFETYIVLFKRGLNETEIDSHFDFADVAHRRAVSRRALPPHQLQETGILRRHQIHEHRSYAAVFDKETRAAIASHPAVALVERDETFEIDHPEVIDAEDVNYEDRSGGLTSIGDKYLQSDAPWGLVSISLDWNTGNPNTASSYCFHKDGQGKGVYAYVVDSGIRTTHGDFEGRAKFGANFVPGEEDTDLDGHGTHVAGTIGGKTFGVAKQVNLISVKILDKKGSGNNQQSLRAFEWIAEDAKKNGRLKKSLINYSVGSKGSTSEAIRDAILNLRKLGIALFAAAGNEAINVENKAPANMKEVFTVGSTGVTLWRAKTSNYGKLIDIWGPGENIQSCGHKSDKASVKMSGTSMATPHVVGLAATFKSHFGSSVDSVDALYSSLIKHGVKDKIKDGKDSPNLFIANGLQVMARPVNPGGGHTRPPV